MEAILLSSQAINTLSQILFSLASCKTSFNQDFAYHFHLSLKRIQYPICPQYLISSWNPRWWRSQKNPRIRLSSEFIKKKIELFDICLSISSHCANFSVFWKKTSNDSWKKIRGLLAVSHQSFIISSHWALCEMLGVISWSIENKKNTQNKISCASVHSSLKLWRKVPPRLVLDYIFLTKYFDSAGF